MTFKQFLETSTIHGLGYIPSTKRFARLFWILVVISGFTFAGYLIYQSFQSWYDSPIRTTIETKTIDKIRFPKVTVCPPKNTYTNLNYDLESMGYKMLNTVTGDGSKLLDDYVKYSQSIDADEEMKNYFHISVQDMFKNWYNDLIEIPSMKTEPYFTWSTSAYKLKGKVTYPQSKNSDIFVEEDFQLQSTVSLSLSNPFYEGYSYSSSSDNKHGYYNIKISYDIEQQKEKIRLSTANEEYRNANLNASINYIEFNITEINSAPLNIQFIRRFQTLDVKKWKNKRNTGFTLEWEYFPTIYENETVNFPYCGEKCTIFKSFVNVLHQKMVSPEDLTKTVRNVMSDWMTGYVDEIGECWRNCKIRIILMNAVFKRLGLTNVPEISTKFDVSNENLEIAAHLMTLLFSKESGKWQDALDEFADSLKKRPIRSLIQSLNMETEDIGKKLVLDKIVNYFNLSVVNITENLSGKANFGI